MSLEPGIYTNFSIDDYHSDPCEVPSLTQTIAKKILRSPAHAFIAHPRLNPNWEPDDDRKYDIGSIYHRLMLGRGRELQVIEGFDDWRKKDAQAAREDAAANGKLGVLSKDYELGLEMMQSAGKQLRQRGYESEWFGDQDCITSAEVVSVARTDTSWLRCMIDWMPSTISIWDLKSTSASASPDAVSRFLPDWCIQAAMHERILNLLDLDNVGRREHRFVVQENYEPYALTVVRLTEAHMTMGRAQIARAEATWARCMATNEWPAYPLEDASPEFPGWMATRILEGEHVTD